mmetsp:Transcript_28381/g.55816  ORF Transcript_28381/g.55816 Transcript_28381/m.55816 type:complete len:81 (-) Transcript_28381:955-1197(-)
MPWMLPDAGQAKNSEAEGHSFFSMWFPFTFEIELTDPVEWVLLEEKGKCRFAERNSVLERCLPLASKVGGRAGIDGVPST